MAASNRILQPLLQGKTEAHMLVYRKREAERTFFERPEGMPRPVLKPVPGKRDSLGAIF